MPFEFGRPLGAPNNPAFQRQVLLAALKLLEAPEGPVVLTDFPQNAPVSAEEPPVLACPYVPPAEESNTTDAEKFCQAFKTEMASLRPWYELAMQKRKRTTLGLSRLSLDEMTDFICSFLAEAPLKNPRQDIPLASELRYAADDLKAYYNEAVTAQPGMETSDSKLLAKWFWENTVAGKVLKTVREACARSQDKALQGVAAGQLVPRGFAPTPAPRPEPPK